MISFKALFNTHFTLFVFALSVILSHSLYAQEVTRPLVSRCDQFLNPLYGEQILIFDPQTYAHIQKHSLSRLARQLHDQNIIIDFDLPSGSSGYFIQGKMLERVLDILFPPVPFYTLPYEHFIQIRLRITDSALSGVPESLELTDFEMPLLKRGNPLIAPLSKKQIRTHFHIPDSAKVVTFYSSATSWFKSALAKIPVQPDVVILSKRGIEYDEDDIAEFERALPGYRAITLTDLEAKYDSFRLKQHQRYLILNNTKRRMMELYTASDYVVVIGANNIFEPLQAHCPLIYFKHSIMGNLFEENENEILENYYPPALRLMSNVVNATRGAVGIIDFSDIPGAIGKIEKIRSKDILHPAFVIPFGRTQSPFDDILDQLEKLIRSQLIENGVSI